MSSKSFAWKPDPVLGARTAVLAFDRSTELHVERDRFSALDLSFSEDEAPSQPDPHSSFMPQAALPEPVQALPHTQASTGAPLRAAAAGIAHTDGAAAPSHVPPQPHQDLAVLLQEQYRLGLEEGLRQARQNPAGLPSNPHPQAAHAVGSDRAGVAGVAEVEGVAGKHAQESDGRSRHDIEQAVLNLDRSLREGLAMLVHPAQHRFEPLKRLAMHLAWQLVQADLSVSTHAIDALIQRCLESLDAGDGQVEVQLNPQDRDLLEEHRPKDAPPSPATLRLRSDEGLSRGSVRVLANHATVEDLIENRLALVLEDLRIDQPSWERQSQLLQQQASALRQQRARTEPDQALSDDSDATDVSFRMTGPAEAESNHD